MSLLVHPKIIAVVFMCLMTIIIGTALWRPLAWIALVPVMAYIATAFAVLIAEFWRMDS